MDFRRVATSLFLGSFAGLGVAQVKPPTLDPTYGLPIPKIDWHRKSPPNSDWIWTANVADNQTIYLRKSFRLNSIPKKALFFITADNHFIAYVNGHNVGSSPVDPSDDNLWQRVQAEDVLPYLKKGVNTIAIKAYNQAAEAGVLARLEVDGKALVLTDKSWKAAESVPAKDWNESSFQDGSWTKATDEGKVGVGPWGDSLRGWPTPIRSVPPYMIHMPIQPVRWAYDTGEDHLVWHSASSSESFEDQSDQTGQSTWRVIYDFGKELAGRIIVQSNGTGIEIGTGESVGEALNRPWTTSVSGKSPYTALRYATLTIPASEKTLNAAVHMDFVYYPVQYLGSFDCSDSLLNKVWYTGAYTAHLCMQRNIWDAPKRDRRRWMGDLEISGEVINNVFADRFLMEQTMRLLRQDAQGGKPETDLPTQNVNGIPGYSYAWMAGLADFYRHSGDKKYLASQHQALLTMLKYCKEDVGSDDLFDNSHHEWVFVDWSPGLSNDSEAARATTDLYLIKGVKEAVFILKQLGDEKNAEKYAKWAKELTASAQAHLLTTDGTFGTREQENAMAIDAGVATTDEVDDIFKAGIFAPETGPRTDIVSPYYGNFVLRAMGDSGHIEQGINYIRSFWGQMILDGATTFYEVYDPFWEKDHFHAHLAWDNHNNPDAGYQVSLCHGWSAGPTNYLTEFVLGVKSTGPGFATCTIEPHLGDLKWAKGKVPTPHGILKVSAAHNDGSMLTVTVQIPNGVQAKFALPNQITKVDGKPFKGSLVELKSGSHTIEGS